MKKILFLLIYSCVSLNGMKHESFVNPALLAELPQGKTTSTKISHKTKKKLCQICHKEIENLKRHMFIHTGEKPYICRHEGCSYSCSDKANFKRHIRIMHPHQQQSGPASTDVVSESTYNMNLHTNEKLYAFTDCSQKLRTPSNHKYHMIKKHFDQQEPGPALTNEPIEIADEYREIAKRLLIADTQKDGIYHESSYNSALLAALITPPPLEEPDIATTQNDTTFACSVCLYRTKQKSHLTRHLRIHTGEELYACQYCGKQFTQSSNRKTHITKKHPMPQEPSQAPVDELPASILGKHAFEMENESTNDREKHRHILDMQTGGEISINELAHFATAYQTATTSTDSDEKLRKLDYE